MKNLYLNGTLSPKALYKTIKYKIKFRKEHPNYFDFDGIYMFCGAQGDGKTCSAVQMTDSILKAYPKAKLVTNIDIKGVTNEVIRWEGIDSLTEIHNGEYGVIYFLDEGHLEFNSLESKNISIDEIESISQQRKERKMIIITAQVYGRVAKPLREQVKYVIVCRNYFGCIQVNKLIDGFRTTEQDGKLETETLHTYFWFHSPELYEKYDTYAKIQRLKNDWKKDYKGGNPRWQN